MIELLVIFGAGVIVGVVYHAKLQPYVARAWQWIRNKAA